MSKLRVLPASCGSGQVGSAGHPRGAARGTLRGCVVSAGVLIALVGAAAGCQRAVPAATSEAAQAATPAAADPPAASARAETSSGSATTTSAKGTGAVPAGGRAAGQPAAKVAVARITPAGAADEIPGVPRVRLPAAKHSPFRSEDGYLGPDPRARGASTGGARGRSGPAASGGRRYRPPTTPPMLPFPVAGVPPEPPALGMAPQGVTPAPRREPAPAAPAPAAQFQLTAIIMGQPPMAVIEGERAHYIVQPGDLVGSGYRVASISLQQVVLRDEEDRPLVLRLGGTKG